MNFPYEKPFSEVVRRERWQVFVTLTFRHLKPERIALSMVRAWLRFVARVDGQKYHLLRWLLRQERGEKLGRYHVHLLIAGLKERTIASYLVLPPGRRSVAQGIWEKLGGGMARLRRMEHDDNGASYVLKCTNGADSYESQKFASSPAVILSDRLRDFVLRRTRRATCCHT
jgi:hypothetical protein